MSHQRISVGRAYKYSFSILGDEDIDEFAVRITSSVIFLTAGQPQDGGPHDLRMGITGRGICHSCFNKKDKCQGHTGYIQSNYPLENQLFENWIIPWLRAVCHHCGKFVVSEKDMTGDFNLKNYADKAKPKTRKSLGETKLEPVECWNCKKPHHYSYRAKENPSIKNLEIITNGAVSEEIQIYNHEIRRIFDRVTNDMLKHIGMPISSHPRKLLIYKVRVPSNHIRPDLKKLNGQRDNTNSATTTIQKLFKVLENIPPMEEVKVDKELGQLLIRADDYYHSLLTRAKQQSKNNLRSTREFISNNEGEPISLRKNLVGKPGLVRKSLKGHRFRGSARAPITPNPYVPLGWVGVPTDICMELTVFMEVNADNIKEANRYYQNGPHNYPGAVSIAKANGGKYAVQGGALNKGRVEVGDILERHVLYGEFCLFNRQPSLWWLSIGCHRIIPMDGQTFQMNVSDCNRYNADFDGDVALIYILPLQMSKAEADSISSVHRVFMSYQTMDPMVGAFQDGLVLLYRLTKSNPGFKIDRGTASYLLRLTPGMQKLTKQSYTGRELISMFIPDNLNYEKTPASYMKAYKGIIPYDVDDINVSVENGQLVSGVLDKGSVGQSTRNSLFQRIYNKFSGSRAIQLVSDMQKITTAMVDVAPMSISLDNICIGREGTKKVHAIVNGVLDEARKITDSIHAGTLKVPIGMSHHDYVESLYMGTLALPDDIVTTVYENLADYKENGIVDLIMSGSKGKKTNLQAISGAIGQVVVKSKRPRVAFGDNRTLPYYHRYDMSPIAHGFVPDNLMNGIDPIGMINMAYQNRDAMTTNSLMTAVSGELARYMCRNMESLHVDNNDLITDGKRIVMCSTEFDQTYNYTVVFPTVACSTKELEDFALTKPTDVKKFKSKNIKALLDDEFKRIVEDRATYRDLYMNAEIRTSHTNMFTDTKRQPIDVAFIAREVVKEYGDSKKSLSPQYCIPQIKKLCEELPYVFVNESCLTRQGYVIPERYQRVCLMTVIQVRSICCYKNLRKMGVSDETLDIITKQIFVMLRRAVLDYSFQVGLVTAQSLAEPSTQMTLDSKHMVGRGGTKTDSLTRLKELMSSKATKDMANPVTVMFLADHSKWGDYDAVKKVAGSLEMIKINQFMNSYAILAETFGNPSYPEFKEDERLFMDFKKYNRMKVPSLANWCIRYELDRIDMVNKSINIDDIVIKLRNLFPNVFLVYSDTNDRNKMVIRVYFLQKDNINYQYILKMAEELINTTIRGVEGLQNFEVIQKNRSFVQKDGSIQEKTVYAISCDGSNIAECLNFSHIIDPELIISDSVMDMYENFGIELALQKLSDELRGLMDSYDISPFHSEFFAIELCRNGMSGPGSTSMQNLRQRENDNPALSMIYSDVMSNLQTSAIQGKIHPARGSAANYMLGQKPRLGTSMNDLIVDEEAFKIDVENLIDEL